VFCIHRYRYSLDRVECHMDPTINKASTGKERTVRVCGASEHTARGPFRARMPHGTARAAHVRLCGQFTAHTARAVKKIENFFFLPLYPSFPPVLGRAKLFFFDQKKIQHRKNRGTRNVICRWREGHQSCAALVKGLLYSSSNNGHEQDLEKYAHGGDSHAKG
jgi:hypothetical protein